MFETSSYGSFSPIAEQKVLRSHDPAGLVNHTVAERRPLETNV
jgi:hypothetical protein